MESQISPEICIFGMELMSLLMFKQRIGLLKIKIIQSGSSRLMTLSLMQISGFQLVEVVT